MEGGKRYSAWPHWADASWASLPQVRGFCGFSISGRIHGQVDQRSQTYFGSWFQFMIALLCDFLAWNEAEYPGRNCVVRKQRENGMGERGRESWDKIHPSTAIFCNFAYLLLQHPSPPSSLLNWIHQWLDEARTLMTQPFLRPHVWILLHWGPSLCLTQPLGDWSDHNWAQLTRIFFVQDPQS